MWQTELVRIIRHMINDLSDSPTYADSRLEELVLVSAQLVSQEVDLIQTYVIDVDQLTLSPDPTDRSNRDEAFINLICLKAACTLDMSEARSSSSQSISIRDGGSAIDLRGRVDSKIRLIDKGWCAMYKSAVTDQVFGSTQVPGAAIMTPFKLYADGFRGGSYFGLGRY